METKWSQHVSRLVYGRKRGEVARCVNYSKVPNTRTLNSTYSHVPLLCQSDGVVRDILTSLFSFMGSSLYLLREALQT